MEAAPSEGLISVEVGFDCVVVLDSPLIEVTWEVGEFKLGEVVLI